MKKEKIKLFCIGRKPSNIKSNELEFVKEESEKFDAVCVFEETKKQKISKLLLRRNMLAPIIDFSGTFGDYADYSYDVFSKENIDYLIENLKPTLDTISKLPKQSDLRDLDELYILQKAYIKKEKIKAHMTSKNKQTVEYPSIFLIEEPKKYLNSLTNIGLLAEKHFTRTNICPDCGSARISIFEACVKCNSSNLKQEDVIHHFYCSYQGAQSEFLEDNKLICPKCHRQLNHFGVDYDKPSIMLKCNNCGEVMQEPETLYKGLDCPSVGSTEKLQTIDWYDYELTNDGINAVLNGYLPQTTLGKAITKHVKTSTFSDFSAITTHGLKVSKRYDRKNTVVKVGIKNKKELLEKNGMSAFSSLVQGVVSSLAEILRETDIVSSKEEDIFIFMPETPKENIKAAFDRVNSNISQNISDNIILETQTASNEEELEKIL